MSIDKLIEDAETIMIHSGEGDTETWKTYAGTRTVRALKAELRRERCGGDRWATVWLSIAPVAHLGHQGDHVIDCLDIEAGEIVDTRSAT